MRALEPVDWVLSPPTPPPQAMVRRGLPPEKLCKVQKCVPLRSWQAGRRFVQVCVLCLAHRPGARSECE